MTPSSRTQERGFTLIEVFVVLSIIGLLISLAIPRYLGTRRFAFVGEADHVLSELKSLGWAYYTQYGTRVGLTDANFTSTVGFQAPDDTIGCWDYSLPADGTGTQIQFRATGDDTPTKCSPVNTGTVTLTVSGDGSSSRSQNLP